MNVAYLNISVAFFVVSWFFTKLFRQAVTERYGTNLPRSTRVEFFCIRDRCGSLRNQQR
jgi:hypothetical protein